MNRRAVGALLAAGALWLGRALPAVAECPDGCIGGGGPAASDCLVQFGGVAANRTVCTDGDPACDADGAINGRCTTALTVCVNLPRPGCTPDAVSGPTVTPANTDTARGVASVLADLDPAHPGCATAAATVAVQPSIRGLKAATAKLAIAAKGRRRDVDRLAFRCDPSATAPSFAAVVQPILTSRCAIVGCHVSVEPNSYPLLEDGSARAALVGQPSRNVPSLQLVVPGDLAGSYLARKVLGKRIVDRTAEMPQGCPHAPPAGGCLTPDEQAAIVAWVAAGAPDN